MAEDYSYVFRRRLSARKPQIGPSADQESDECAPRSFPSGHALDGKTRSDLNDWAGMLGEQYVEKQTGDINNIGPGLIGTFELLPGVRVTPDSIDLSLGWPPVIGDVKVGVFSDYEQAEELVSAIDRGMARPGIIYMLESPVTGESRARSGIKNSLSRTGFGFVYFRGPWWEFFQ